MVVDVFGLKNKRMKIGILYICTGKYSIFWKDFYLTCEKNFINEAEKHYFVFTDAENIDFEKENYRIHKIYQENLGWPDNTLKRYHIFLKHIDKYHDIDYLFYLNANLLFLEKINTEEFLPQEDKNKKIIGCLHPGYYNKKTSRYPYEKRSKSTAFIEKTKRKYYFAGGINGGATKDFIDVMKILNENIEKDYKDKIIARWHDESHWNWYLNNNLDIIKMLNPSFLYPEGWNIPFKKKILIRDKRLIGGHSKLRGKIQPKLILGLIKFYIFNLFKK